MFGFVTFYISALEILSHTYLLIYQRCCIIIDRDFVCQELQDSVNQELSVIQQTSNALNQCCHGNSAFAGSAEAVECHRLLLVACEFSRTRTQRPLLPWAGERTCAKNVEPSRKI